MTARLGLLLALALHALLAGGYLVSTPVWEAPDESGHFAYTRHVLRHGEWPLIPGTAEANGEPAWREASMAHHPPLYYVLLGATQLALGARDLHPVARLRPPEERSGLSYVHGYDEAGPVSAEVLVFRLLRGWSVLLGLASVGLTFALGRRAFPSRHGVAVGGACLLATLPAWSAASGVLDNGNLAVPLGLGALVLFVDALRSERGLGWRAAFAGTLLGLALLTKMTAIALVPVALLAAVLVVRRAEPRGRALVALGIGGGITCLVIAPFLARNLAWYGELLATSAHHAAYAENAWPEGYAGEALRALPARLVRSTVFWAGWGGVDPPTGLVPGALVVLGLALVGWLRSGRVLAERPGALLLLVVTSALVLATVVRFNLVFNQPQWRYLFAAAGPAALLVAAGLAGLHRRALQVVVPACGVAAVCVLLLHVRPTLALAEPTDRYFASLVLDTSFADAPSEGMGLEVHAPDDGVTLAAPPRFAWTFAANRPVRPVSLHVTAVEQTYLAALHEDGALRLEGTEWAIPPDLWARLPVGVELRWRVRELPDRSAGEATRDMAASGAGSFVRAP